MTMMMIMIMIMMMMMMEMDERPQPENMSAEFPGEVGPARPLGPYGQMSGSTVRAPGQRPRTLFIPWTETTMKWMTGTPINYIWLIWPIFRQVVIVSKLL